MSRMLCADCGAMGFAETWLEGSDRIELGAWLIGGLAGWLYCAWRHALRGKRCAECGGAALVRETRASASRAPVAPPSGGVRIVSGSGRVRWPAALRDPRDRLRLGSAWLAAWILAAAGLPHLGATLGVAWILVLTGRVVRREVATWRCGAWDAEGRPLHIELA